MLKRLVTSSLLIILAAIVFIVLYIRWSEPRMLYYPTREIAVTPDRLNLQYEDVNLTTADGVRINGWSLPCGRPARRTVLFLHGNAGNISHRFEKFEVFRDLSTDVFIIDYRGFGRSEGKPNEQGTYRDAEAAYDYLAKVRQVRPQSIVVYGESLGSAVATELASKHPVGAVVLEAVFTSTADVGQKMFPFLPVRWLVQNKYDSLSKIGNINAPLLILHSRQDEFFPMEHARRLLEAAKAPKQLVELEGGHNDAFLISALTYRYTLKRFLDTLPDAAPAP